MVTRSRTVSSCAGSLITKVSGRLPALAAYVAETRYVAPVCPVPMAVTSTSDNRTGVPRLLRTVESHSTVMSSGYRGMDMGIIAPFAGSTDWTTVRHSATGAAGLPRVEAQLVR